MVEREKGARASPITADVKNSLGVYPRSRPRRRSPRNRLLWLVVVLLIVAWIGFAYWENRQRQELEGRLDKLQGQLSNVHARLDGLEPMPALESNELETRLDQLTALQQEQQQRFSARLEAQQQQLGSLDQRFATSAAQERLVQRIDSLAKAQESLRALMTAAQGSLNSLEESSKAARGILHAQLDTQQRELEKLKEGLQQGRQRQSAQEVVGASLMVAIRTLENQVEKHRETLEELQVQQTRENDMLETLEETLADRITKHDRQLEDQRSALKELRQMQVALSAQLEMLQGSP